MAGPPPHPDTGITDQGSGQSTGWPRWRTTAIVIIGLALLVVMVIVHLTGTLGPGSHG
jgi:hypothetical protein